MTTLITDTDRIVTAFDRVTDIIESIRGSMSDGVSVEQIPEIIASFNEASNLLELAAPLCDSHRQTEIHYRLSVLLNVVVNDFGFQARMTIDNLTSAILYRNIKGIK